MILPWIVISSMMYGIFCIVWLIHGISMHKTEKLYTDFYQKYGEYKHAEIISYRRVYLRTKGESIYHITFRFQYKDKFDKNYERDYTIHTNHHAAKKYANLKETEILCLPDAIQKNHNMIQYIREKSRNETEFLKICNIPYAVLPEEENFMRSGRIERLQVMLFVFLFFACFGTLLLICE